MNTLQQEHSYAAHYFGDRPDWVIVTTRNRDSNLLDESNWDAFISALGGESETVAIERSSHFLCGWVEYMVIDPTATDKLEIANKLLERMEDYPVLDEEDFSSREWDNYQDAWRDWGCSEFTRALKKAFGLRDSTVDWLDEYRDELQPFYESLITSGEYYIPDSDGVTCNIDSAIWHCTRQDLAAFLRGLR